ncbi:Flp pilus assembly protein CpaB [Herbaspirillum sp. HC18]|nr:Flp pilus assembly protein CpaB [Herbaspirillum sp. HC18]
MKLALPRNIKLNKTWIILGVALGVGLLAALLARGYLSSQMAAIEARAKGNQINVVVANRQLKKGERISTENVAMRAIPVDYAHSGAVSPNDFERLEGQALAYPVKPGEMILWSLMETKKAPTFSARIEAGHRAITVPVDEINSISGMLEPGDTIDLMVTIDQKGKKVTFPMLQSVQVMATGQRSVDDPKNGERRQYTTVTLDTTPEQAQNVIFARDAGKLTALLRNPQDKQSIGNGGADLAALLGLKGRGNAIGEEGDSVPVLYGGRSGKLPPEGLMLGQYVRPANDVTTDVSSTSQTGANLTSNAGSGAAPAPIMSGGPVRQH